MPAPTQPTNPPATHGKNGVLCLSTSRNSTPVPVALVKEYSLDRSTDLVETSAFGDRNKTYVQGLPNTQGTFSAEWNAIDDSLFDAADSPDGCQMEIWPSKDSAVCFKGPAWISASIKGGISSSVSIDGTFTANGSWTRTSPVSATGATAGTPGSFTPAGAVAPVNLGAMTGVVATPNTVWSTGQYVTLGDMSQAHWSGTAWAVGPKTLAAGETQQPPQQPAA